MEHICLLSTALVGAGLTEDQYKQCLLIPPEENCIHLSQFTDNFSLENDYNS